VQPELAVAGADLHAYSYGLVEVAAFGAKISLKDASGKELCVKTIGG
jgi:hypothetical protein